MTPVSTSILCNFVINKKSHKAKMTRCMVFSQNCKNSLHVQFPKTNKMAIPGFSKFGKIASEHWTVNLSIQWSVNSSLPMCDKVNTQNLAQGLW